MNEYEVAVAPIRGGAWSRFRVTANGYNDAKAIAQNMYRGVGEVMFVKQVTWTQRDRNKKKK